MSLGRRVFFEFSEPKVVQLNKVNADKSEVNKKRNAGRRNRKRPNSKVDGAADGVKKQEGER